MNAKLPDSVFRKKCLVTYGRNVISTGLVLLTFLCDILQLFCTFLHCAILFALYSAKSPISVLLNFLFIYLSLQLLLSCIVKYCLWVQAF